MTNKVNIDGKEYEADKLPPEAISHIGGLQFCDLELKRLQMSIATVQTSRAAYAQALSAALENVPFKNVESSEKSEFNFASDTIKFN